MPAGQTRSAPCSWRSAPEPCSGFWRSSVRRRGPPAMSWNRFSDRRRRACGDRLADRPTPPSLWQQTDPFALRVARPSARTRCGPPIANCSAGVCGKPSPHVGNATGAPAPIPVLAVDLADISLNHNSERRTSKPRLGTTWDIFRRPRRPMASQMRYRDSQSHLSQETREHGTFQPRSRTVRNVPNVPQTSPGQVTFATQVTHRYPAQQPNRDVSTASQDVLPAY